MPPRPRLSCSHLDSVSYQNCPSSNPQTAVCVYRHGGRHGPSCLFPALSLQGQGLVPGDAGQNLAAVQLGRFVRQHLWQMCLGHTCRRNCSRRNHLLQPHLRLLASRPCRALACSCPWDLAAGQPSVVQLLLTHIGPQTGGRERPNLLQCVCCASAGGSTDLGCGLPAAPPRVSSCHASRAVSSHRKN